MSWPPTSHTVKEIFLYSTVSTLNPVEDNINLKICFLSLFNFIKIINVNYFPFSLHWEQSFPSINLTLWLTGLHVPLLGIQLHSQGQSASMGMNIKTTYYDKVATNMCIIVRYEFRVLCHTITRRFVQHKCSVFL